ncbi:hypothetical protein J437_LFUL005414 [Ladona fulva]|uniref:Uncharacterized protein n=1 Tax=Ladona fulva TaxID=123851 RepID=A0A8K0NYC6_LADFU|nr:hypothetical protein J437_LFUL005414 [Ladona fulva]
MRKHKVRDLKTQLTNQQSVFKKPRSQAVTTASFKVSYLLTKKCKPFSDGEFLKEIFLEMSDSLFNDFKNKSEIVAAIQDLQLSRNTVMRRIEVMSGNVKEQLYSYINRCSWFSLPCDESTDISDTAQLLVFVSMVFKDLHLKKNCWPYVKIEHEFPAFLSYHCIIHQQVLASKRLNTKEEVPSNGVSYNCSSMKANLNYYYIPMSNG